VRQSVHATRWFRALAASYGLHVAALLVAMVALRSADLPESPWPVDAAVTMTPALPPPPLEVKVVSVEGRAGAPPRRDWIEESRPHPRQPAPPRPTPEVVAPAMATVAMSSPNDDLDQVAAVEAPGDPGDEAELTSGEGVAAGSGTAPGTGEGGGVSGWGTGDQDFVPDPDPVAIRLGGELHARVVGGSGTEVYSRDGLTFISNKEATGLRTRDYFPRLPGALWPQRGPYIVELDVCVTEQGQVSDASLRSSASRRLDPLVRDAVTGWLYQPRVVDGRRVPFCHGIVIKYERW
jgi:hypothetical protein